MSPDPKSLVEREGGVRHVLRESFLTGFAVVAPALVTFYLLLVAFDFVLSIVRPVARVVLLTLVPSVSETVATAGAALSLLGLVFVVGFVAHFHSGELVLGEVDTLVTRIPLVGTVYGSFRRMSDAMFASDQESFREVVLLELPSMETYMLGFRITDADEAVGRAGDMDDPQTVFVPLAPNPVMAGFLVHVPDERIHEVDMSVEQGVSAIVSLGAAEGEADAEASTMLADV